jgi:hypothetical protein
MILFISFNQMKGQDLKYIGVSNGVSKVNVGTSFKNLNNVKSESITVSLTPPIKIWD